MKFVTISALIVLSFALFATAAAAQCANGQCTVARRAAVVVMAPARVASRTVTRTVHRVEHVVQRRSVLGRRAVVVQVAPATVPDPGKK